MAKAKFKYSMKTSEAILAFKRGFLGQGLGNLLITKDKGYKFVLGAPPLMKVKVTFIAGIIETKAHFFGKWLLPTVNIKLELIEGFTRISR